VLAAAQQRRELVALGLAELDAISYIHPEGLLDHQGTRMNQQ